MTLIIQISCGKTRIDLRKAQRKLSKRQRGSRNWHKQKLRVAKIHEKIVNHRRDFRPKKARYLVDRYAAIGMRGY